MAKLKKWKIEKNYVEIPNETAKAPENNISLQALGLIVNLWSYDIETWELHKTELYKRFVNNKETSVRNAWKELMDHKYIIEYKYREGKKWVYEYYYKITPFKDEEIASIYEMAKEEHGEIWGLDFQDLKMKTSKSRGNKEKINKKQINKEEEEIKTDVKKITVEKVIEVMHQKIKEREISNKKTIKAILSVAEKCKAIGTDDYTSLDNYVIKVVEEKMSKLGQKQKLINSTTSKTFNNYTRVEKSPLWLNKSNKEDNKKTEDNNFYNEIIQRYKQETGLEPIGKSFIVWLRENNIEFTGF